MDDFRRKSKTPEEFEDKPLSQKLASRKWRSRIEDILRGVTIQKEALSDITFS